MTNPHSNANAVPLGTVRSVLAGLVDEQALSSAQATAITTRLWPLAAAPSAPGSRARTRLTEVAGYVGGAMVLGGVGAIVGPAWGGMTEPARLVLGVVATLLLAAGAVGVWLARTVGEQFGESARRRLASTLGALAAGGAAITVAVPVPTGAELLAASIAALVVAAGGYLLMRGAPLLVTAWLASTWLLSEVLDRAHTTGELPWVLGYAVFGGTWLALSSVTRERGLAALLGGLTGLGAAESAAAGGTGMAMLGLAIGVAFAAAGFGLYVGARHWAALVPPVLIALVVPATALAVLFESLFAAGLAVAVAGLLLLALGVVTIATHRRTGQVHPA